MTIQWHMILISAGMLAAIALAFALGASVGVHWARHDVDRLREAARWILNNPSLPLPAWVDRAVNGTSHGRYAQPGEIEPEEPDPDEPLREPPRRRP
jgi:hypothetical protein